MTSQLSILIADDHTLLRFGLKESLEKLYPNAALYEAENLSDVTSFVHGKIQIDLILLDIKMPGSNNQTIKTFLKNKKTTKVLIYTALEDHIAARRFLRMGADGFVNKKATIDEIYTATEAVFSGSRYIDNETKKKFLNLAINGQTADQDVSELSSREYDICLFIAKGQRLSDIANKMNLHISTVSTYKQRAYDKLKVTSDSELIVLLKNQFII